MVEKPRKKYISPYCTIGRHYGIQKISMCQKSRQIDKMCGGKTDTIYITAN